MENNRNKGEEMQQNEKMEQRQGEEVKKKKEKKKEKDEELKKWIKELYFDVGWNGKDKNLYKRNATERKEGNKIMEGKYKLWKKSTGNCPAVGMDWRWKGIEARWRGGYNT